MFPFTCLLDNKTDLSWLNLKNKVTVLKQCWVTHKKSEILKAQNPFCTIKIIMNLGDKM